MTHSDEQSVRTTVLRFGSLDFVFNGSVELPAGAVFSRSQPEAPVSPQDQPPKEPRTVKSAADRVWDLVVRNMVIALGPNPSQELFRFAVFATSMLVFGLYEEKILFWDEFKLCYDSVYLEGQMWLPCGGITVPVTMGDAHSVPSEASQASCDDVKSTPPSKKVLMPHDPRRECLVLQQQADAVHSTNSDKSSGKVRPLRPMPLLSRNPRRTRVTMSGSVLASTSSTRLRRLSTKRYAAASTVTFMELPSQNGPPRTSLQWPCSFGLALSR
jgi:hypothetical protein